MKTETVASITAVLDGLRARQREHEATVAEATAVRQEHALTAEQGDRTAVAKLEKAERAEAAAKRGLKNVALAIAEAEKRLLPARERESEAARQDQRLQFDKATDEYLAADTQIYLKSRDLRKALDVRQAKLDHLLQLATAGGFLPPFKMNVLAGGDALAEGLAGMLGHDLGHRNNQHTPGPGALDDWLAADCTLLGRMAVARRPSVSDRVLAQMANNPPAKFPIQAA